MTPTSEFVDWRNEAYYIAGTRIGLDVLHYEFQDGRSAESIFDSFPAIGSLAKVYGAIAFMLSHPYEVKAYLKDQEQRFEEIKSLYPHSPKILQVLEDAKRAASEK